ncbi:MAG TPA: hypothetical protein VG865_04295, partial [Casimicrobiaceae bacterium]|nr:hypothetical protein [Casimicrobiaceae bacterium]
LEEFKQVAASEADHARDLADYAMHDEQRSQQAEGEPTAQHEAGRGEVTQGIEHVARNGQRAANEAPNVEAETNVESQLTSGNEPAHREARERGRARR